MNREQHKLLFSLITNFLTRIPGAVGLLWFLPLLRFGLGTDDYADLLTSMALGTAAAFLLGGFGLVGRRLIGEAYATGDRVREANSFISLVAANAVALVIALAIIACYCTMRGISLVVLGISMLPAFSAFFNTFDNVRLAYNEHYTTAIIQFLLQIIIYSIGFLVPATQHSLVLGALVIQGHYMLTSLITLFLLLRARPYLLAGRSTDAWSIARGGTRLAIADGFVITTLSLSVVWLQAVADAPTSAWFATLVRLFQTFLVPVILLLFPLSSYIRIIWNSKSVAQQQASTKATLLIGVGYGACVALALLVASRWYIDGLLNLPAPGGLLQITPILVLFGAIVAYKSYSSIAYIVLEESTHLSSWITIVITVSVMVGAVASFTFQPMGVIDVYALAAGLSMITVLFWNAGRFIRLSPPVAS